MALRSACDRTRLEAYLSDQLDLGEESQLHRHLDECDACRQQLSAIAGDADAWSAAERFLNDQADDLMSVRGGDDLDDDAELETSAHIDGVLGALDPTDDPRMLGRLAGYEISGVIGYGGMGVVLKAHDRSLDRIVAIKVMAPHLASSGAARRRFAREARAAAAVLHPNVISIFAVSNDAALPLLVMPYIRGESLQSRIDRVGPLPAADVLRIGRQIAAGLAAAHAQGLIHRDIKPANILLDSGTERVTITDFGLARAVDDASLTRSGVIAGTPQYMSPEQVRGEPLDARSDLFSLGSVLYAMCSGHHPFRAETTFGLIRRVSEDPAADLQQINADVPAWLCRLVERLHTKEPAQRIGSAAEAEALLEACSAHLEQPTNRPLPAELARPAKGKSSEWVMLAAAAGVVAVSAILGLWFGGGTIAPFTFESETVNESTGFDPAQTVDGQPDDGTFEYETEEVFRIRSR